MVALLAGRPAYLGSVTAALTLAVAVAAAAIVGPDGGPLTLRVEEFSSSLADLLRAVGAVLPLGYAFSAGLLAAVNPCGFALLPAYLGLYLGTNAAKPDQDRSFARALFISAAVTAVFVSFFGLVGLLLASATSAIAGSFPWAGLVVGVLLAVAGGRMLAGGYFYASLPDRLGLKVGGLSQRGDLVGYLAYGLAFALTSLGCTLPIFLTVVGSALTAGGLAAGLTQFVLYGLGMGSVISTVTILAGLFGRVMLGPTRRLGPYLQPASACLLLLTGGYVVFYWLTLGGLLRR
jgi:cytochrome c biogenesis protein CcdA